MHFPIRSASEPSLVKQGTDAREACPYVILSFLSLSNSSRTSEIPLRLNLSCSTSSFRWCSTRRTRNSSAWPSAFSSYWSIWKIMPSIISELSSSLSSSACSTHSRLPSNRTSPGLRHTPSVSRILVISQRGRGSVESLFVSSGATGVRFFRLGLSTSPANGTRPKARVEGEVHPNLRLLRPQ